MNLDEYMALYTYKAHISLADHNMLRVLCLTNQVESCVVSTHVPGDKDTAQGLIIHHVGTHWRWWWGRDHL